MPKLSVSLFVLLTFMAAPRFAAGAPQTNATALRAVLMPYKLVGNIDAKLDGEHQQRLTMADNELRSRLLATRQYDLVDAAASEEFTKKVTTALSNNNCDKCESVLAKELNAKLIIVPWVYRLSQLVLTMHFDIIDTGTGKIILKKTLDFRGDNDKSWQRAIDYFIKNIEKP